MGAAIINYLTIFWSALIYIVSGMPTLKLSPQDQEKWIVVLKRLSQTHLQDHLEWLSSKAKTQHCVLHHQWNATSTKEDFNGYAVSNLDAGLVNELRSHSAVHSVQRENTFKASTIQWNAPWSLSYGNQRINERKRRKVQKSQFEYASGDSETEVTDVYVLDSGIDIHHPEFEGRAVHGFSIGKRNHLAPLSGHGTHVAGIIGSKSFGVAKSKARLIDVQVLDWNGEASSSDILHGIQWILNRATKKPSTRKAIINVSFNGPPDEAVDAILGSAVQMGIPVVSAAGNNEQSACSYSPSRSPHILTVGATDSQDRMTSYTNFGSCVDLFAPGTQIKSLWPSQQTRVLDGTSGAAPHVAGVLALLMSEKAHASKTVTELYQLLAVKATRGLIQGLPKDTRNALLFYSPRTL